MVAFTAAQWRELERQAMIFKYMISSLPVPPHLLYTSHLSLYNVGYTKNGVALEPGRCKRTDGKKWRCSRDVAPHQKYCERHLHRSRPRSRKHVELLTITNKINGDDDDKQKKPRLDQTKPHLSTMKGTNMDLGLMMENETVEVNEAERKWFESNTGFTNSISASNSAVHYHQDSNHVLSYSDFPTLEIDAPIGFMDAWSNSDILNLGPTLQMGNDNFSPSLSLSIGGGSGLDEQMGNAQASDGGVGFYSENSSWSSSPVCWGSFGGPLAEALCTNPLASPRDSISGAVTTVSSPSGVTQRTLFSHSGGSSVCNSPSEIGFQWIK